tara:strand:+ start:239 stop:499 length:261 start_codon:yes stop_codon:yes gene_type:complete
MVKKEDNIENQRFSKKDFDAFPSERHQSKSSMQDVQELQVIVQLIDNMDVVVRKLEGAYEDKDGEGFKKSKMEILKSQKQIGRMLG